MCAICRADLMIHILVTLGILSEITYYGTLGVVISYIFFYFAFIRSKYSFQKFALNTLNL
jgi:hypothetical protein